MFDKGSSHRNRRLFSFSDAGIAQPFMEVISMDKIKALNTKVMAKDFGRVGLGTLAIVAGAFLWGKFLYGRGVRGSFSFSFHRGCFYENGAAPLE